MRYADFGEGQLQMLVNLEIVRHVIALHNHFPIPIVPTLPEEFLLGWDTGFNFPFVPILPSQENRSCNFFIQYKISEIVEGHGGGQYHHWHEEYYRFTIPHYVSSNANGYQPDYHQFHALSALSQSFPVYYATNSTVYLDDLAQAARQNNLLNRIPLVDVAEVVDEHTYVTFTQSSPHFVLCSPL